MSKCVLLVTLFILPFTVGLFLISETEEVCAGKEFRLPVYSTSRTVTFTPDSGEPKRVLLENTSVKDPRFELTKGRMLVLRGATESDEGLYSIKLASGFAYETVRLKVLDCITSYTRYYGETFMQTIPENASLLEFSPLGNTAKVVPVVLWNRTDPEVGGRGRLEQGGKLWVAEGVTQEDQGNYTVRNVEGDVLSRSRLAVHARSFNLTRFIKGSMNLPFPVPRGNLMFIPAQYLTQSNPEPHHVPARLIKEGKITGTDMRYRGLISFRANGSSKEVVIESLTLGHSGVYEIRDGKQYLVSSTVLEVNEKQFTWNTIYTFFSGSSGAFLGMTTLFLFLKRYPGGGSSCLTSCFRRKRKPAVNPPRINIQDYSQASTQPSGCSSNAQKPGTPKTCTPKSSPARSGYSSVTVDTPRAQKQELNRPKASDSPCHKNASNDKERSISFFVPGPTDCLHSSDDCIQFPMKKGTDRQQQDRSHDYFLSFPLDTVTSESGSVYISEKLNIC